MSDHWNVLAPKANGAHGVPVKPNAILLTVRTAPAGRNRDGTGSSYLVFKLGLDVPARIGAKAEDKIEIAFGDGPMRGKVRFRKAEAVGFRLRQPKHRKHFEISVTPMPEGWSGLPLKDAEIHYEDLSGSIGPGGRLIVGGLPVGFFAKPERERAIA